MNARDIGFIVMFWFLGIFIVGLWINCIDKKIDKILQHLNR